MTNFGQRYAKSDNNKFNLQLTKIMVELNDDIKTIERGIDIYSYNSGFAMYTILSPKSQILIRWFFDEFRKFSTIVRL